MRTLALVAVILVGMPLASGVAAPRTKGKVVRIERQRTTTATPRVCEVRNNFEGTCFGPEPLVGEMISVLTEIEVVAEARVTEVYPFATGSGSCVGLWNIKSELVRGDVANVRGRLIGVVDREMHPQKGHILQRDELPPSPTGNVDDVVSIAVDRDGDKIADILVVQNACDGGASGTCLDEWARVNGKMVRVQQTNFVACGF